MTRKMQFIEQDCCTFTPPESVDLNVATGEEIPMLKILPFGTNWDLWKESIKKEAQREGVWQYCDPDTAEEFYPEPEEPKLPQTLQKGPGAEAIDDLGDEYFMKLYLCVNRYYQEYLAWAKIKCNIQRISNLIKTHIHTRHLECIEGEESPRKQLEILAVELRPFRVDDLEPEWEGILTLASDPAIENFFEAWGSFAEKCSEFVSDDLDWKDDTLRDILRKTGGPRGYCEPLGEQYWIQRLARGDD